MGNMRGHGDAVISMIVDWPSRRALTGSHDCRLKLWDLDHSMCVGTLLSLGHPAFCLAADWTAARAISGSWDHTLKVWDLERSESSGQLVGHQIAVTCVSMDWQQQRALSGAADGELKLWDLSCGTELWSDEAHACKITALSVDWHERRAVSGDDGGTLKLWRIHDPGPASCVASRRGHRLPVAGVAADWEAQPRRALSASWDGSLKTWDLNGEALSCTSTITHAPGAAAVAVTCMQVDWTTLCVVIGCAKTLKVWDLDSGDELHALAGHEDSVSCLALEPGGA